MKEVIAMVGILLSNSAFASVAAEQLENSQLPDISLKDSGYLNESVRINNQAVPVISSSKPFSDVYVLSYFGLESFHVNFDNVYGDSGKLNKNGRSRCNHLEDFFKIDRQLLREENKTESSEKDCTPSLEDTNIKSVYFKILQPVPAGDAKSDHHQVDRLSFSFERRDGSWSKPIEASCTTKEYSPISYRLTFGIGDPWSDSTVKHQIDCVLDKNVGTVTYRYLKEDNTNTNLGTANDAS